MAYKRKSSYRRKGAMKRRTYRRKTKVTKRVKRYVKNQIARATENNYAVETLVNQPISTVVGATPTALTLLPSLSTGSTRYQRVGNKIKIRKAWVKGSVNLLPYSATTNPTPAPIAVKMWLMSSKAYNDIGAFSGTSAATAFFKGAQAPTGMTGNVLDLFTEIDTENFIVHGSKVITLHTSGGSYDIPSTIGNAVYDTGKAYGFFRFNIGRVYKELNFNDTSSSSICTNHNLWLVFQPVSLNGSVTTTPAEFHCMKYWEFEG